MSDLCLDEGTLQSYCDGQLEPKVLEKVSLHMASCSFCTEAARQVESEMEQATAAFVAELSLSVPSERLRSRLDEAITGLNAQPLLHEERTPSRLHAWLAVHDLHVATSRLNLTEQHHGKLPTDVRQKRERQRIHKWHARDPQFAMAGPIDVGIQPERKARRRHRRTPFAEERDYECQHGEQRRPLFADVRDGQKQIAGEENKDVWAVGNRSGEEFQEM